MRTYIEMIEIIGPYYNYRPVGCVSDDNSIVQRKAEEA